MPRTRFSVRMSSSSSTARHGVEPGGGLVEEEEVRLEGHGPRDGRALLHAAGDLRREAVLRRTEADEAQLGAHDGATASRGRSVHSLERERDVLAHGERAEERAGLEHHPERRPPDVEAGARRRPAIVISPAIGCSRPTR